MVPGLWPACRDTHLLNMLSSGKIPRHPPREETRTWREQEKGQSGESTGKPLTRPCCPPFVALNGSPARSVSRGRRCEPLMFC